MKWTSLMKLHLYSQIRNLKNSIKDKNLEDVKKQLKRSEAKKNTLIKNICKEYENYFQIIRKSLYPSVEKGIISLYSDNSNNEKVLNSNELINFLKKNISLLIHSKIPLITIEQLNLGDVFNSQNQFLKIEALKPFTESRELQTINFDYQNDITTKAEFLKFNSKNNTNTYEYYETLSKDELLSVNLDQSIYQNSLSNQKNIKQIDDEQQFGDYFFELIEESNNINKKFNDYENINHQLEDVYIPTQNLSFFEGIDKSLSNLFLNLTYRINVELFKINLINKIITEEDFKCYSYRNYLIKHPYPFVNRYYLNQNKISENNIGSSDILLLNINNVELEFYNLELSICRNNINQLKHQFRLLNKKQKHWKHRELNLKNLN
mgnify:CR=1 FL=1